VLGPGLLRFEAAQPSVEARSDDLAHELWTLTAQAVANAGDKPSAGAGTFGKMRG
jgi:hypothetical protein